MTNNLFLGAYVPLTMEGNIVVEGVLASCYADFHHDLAHLGLIPVQMFPVITECLFGDVAGFLLVLKELGKILLPDGQYLSY